MRVTPDTNILVRVAIGDDPVQSPAARIILESADIVAVTLPALCELVWVLRAGFKVPHGRIAQSIMSIIAAENVAVDRVAVEAGLAFLEAGGDFADGIIAYEGRRLGGATFVTFDTKALALARRRGVDARQP